MADSAFKINRGITLNPQNVVPADPINGDMYFDANAGTYIVYQDGFWINLASQVDVEGIADITSAQMIPSVVQNSLVRIIGTTASNLDGISASTHGKRFLLYNFSSQNVTIINQSPTEPGVDNRISTSTAGNIVLQTNQIMEFVYDGSQNRWVTVANGGGLAFDVNTILTDDNTGAVLVDDNTGDVLVNG